MDKYRTKAGNINVDKLVLENVQVFSDVRSYTVTEHFDETTQLLRTIKNAMKYQAKKALEKEGFTSKNGSIGISDLLFSPLRGSEEFLLCVTHYRIGNSRTYADVNLYMSGEMYVKITNK